MGDITMISKAIFKLYPNAVGYKGPYEDGNYYVFDESYNEISIDLIAVNQEAQAQAEAKAQLRASVINKIATNLTSEEKLWLEENL
jgi:hypothetical protein